MAGAAKGRHGHRPDRWWRCLPCLHHPVHALRTRWATSNWPSPVGWILFGMFALILSGVLVGVVLNDYQRGYRGGYQSAAVAGAVIAVVGSLYMTLNAIRASIEQSITEVVPDDEPYDQDANS